ncbi:hypothetical protein DM02DRAFT_614255 [Periconia macrospinosa]|uniref:Zn(2)-C6 fungal-type domain-containing protein n=1 Tax=Periconia macrospinosa TaxID=97972 RepID=A0A2V1DTE4_9PLEO|nr:hypothetical protein DM02DRAFT_614255 [Periconia macrospinosa]
MPQFHTSVIEFRSLKTGPRYGAKVKTGCITCKNRRVKCDEAKPSCVKCSSTGRICEGYTRSKSGVLGLDRKSVIRHESPPVPSSVDVLSEYGEGLQYFEFYQNCVGHSIATAYDSNFWCRVAPRMAQTEPSIRHALIALGYFNKATTGSLKHARLSDERHETLFFHYNKAVRSLIERMKQISFDPEIGLVTCILFVCIEFLRGDFITAFTHLQNGLKMISEWHLRRPGRKTHKKEQRPKLRAIVHSALESTDIMTELIPLFFRTTTVALLFGVRAEKIIEISSAIPKQFQFKPFRDVWEARAVSLDFQNAALIFTRDNSPRVFPVQPLTGEALKTQESILESHRSWRRAFEAFERNATLSPAEQVVVRELKAGYHCTYFSVSCITWVKQSGFDQYLWAFKEIVEHTRFVFDAKGLPDRTPPTLTEPLLVPKPSGHRGPPSRGIPSLVKPYANFTFEVVLLPCLYFVIQRCRDPIIRREALALMERNPPREALLDYEVAAIAARRVIEIEESMVDPATGWPVEETRLWHAVVDGTIDNDGGFWIMFSNAVWIAGGGPSNEEEEALCKVPRSDTDFRGRVDSQWQEYYTVNE